MDASTAPPPKNPGHPVVCRAGACRCRSPSRSAGGSRSAGLSARHHRCTPRRNVHRVLAAPSRAPGDDLVYHRGSIRPPRSSRPGRTGTGPSASTCRPSRETAARPQLRLSPRIRCSRRGQGQAPTPLQRSGTADLAECSGAGVPLIIFTVPRCNIRPHSGREHVRHRNQVRSTASGEPLSVALHHSPRHWSSGKNLLEATARAVLSAVPDGGLWDARRRALGPRAIGGPLSLVWQGPSRSLAVRRTPSSRRRQVLIGRIPKLRARIRFRRPVRRRPSYGLLLSPRC